MDLFETVLCVRELLVARGVELHPGHADASEFYEGPGPDALSAWEAFRAIAIEPALDPVMAWGEERAVDPGGFLFEARPSAEQAELDGNPAVPEHYNVAFVRQFDVEGNLKGLSLTVAFPLHTDLRGLKDSIFGDRDPAADLDDLDAYAAGARAWIACVEASPAFAPMVHNRADVFAFGIDEVG